MNVKALALASALATVVLVCVTVLLLKHVDPTPFIAVIGVVAGPIIAAVLYGKVEQISSKADQISQNTNGTTLRMQDLLSSVVEHLKTHNTVPIPDQQAPNSTTTLTTTNTTEPKG